MPQLQDNTRLSVISCDDGNVRLVPDHHAAYKFPHAECAAAPKPGLRNIDPPQCFL
jgi:hypothetical protein